MSSLVMNCDRDLKVKSRVGNGSVSNLAQSATRHHLHGLHAARRIRGIRSCVVGSAPKPVGKLAVWADLLGVSTRLEVWMVVFVVSVAVGYLAGVFIGIF